jgi:hypothetical protein
MSEFPKSFNFADPMATVCSHGPQSLGAGAYGIGLGAGSYPAANIAIFVPFRIGQPIKFSTMFIYNGASVSGNIDVGVYACDGTKIVSTGSTAQAGTSSIQTFTVTTTELDSGLFYFAVAMDNATGTLYRHAPSPAAMVNFQGVAQMAAAFPLPATATLATTAYGYAPLVGLTIRSFV